ncbi:hypothetical protein C900_00850 [Fulvivirga imtechensis AK7]|uniref:Uncharacterized protein n=1 Tax=Fulvivirga imtechensis AK7 TaxID=1237149 RepID=L8JZ18_9BACT|nr:hypothetical protein C900_00850 [Fulvivirga imtechensis AK7]
MLVVGVGKGILTVPDSKSKIVFGAVLLEWLVIGLLMLINST